MVAGLPASGKSTFAKIFKGKILEFDSIAEKFGGYEELNENVEEANRLFHLEALFSQPKVIVDTFHRKSSRLDIIQISNRPVEVVIVKCPLDICLKRNNLRNNSLVSNEEILNIFYSWEPVALNEKIQRIWEFDSINNVLSLKEESLMKSYAESPVVEEGRIYLKKIDNEVRAYGDLPSLQGAEEKYQTGQLFDTSITLSEWIEAGNAAYISDGNIILGTSEERKRALQEEAIRRQRDILLRACDKISPMRWIDMTEEQRQAWIDYRQALLDIPQQEEFPWNGDVEKVPWPVKPQ